MTIEIVDFPMKNGGSFHSYVKLPEGKPETQLARSYVLSHFRILESDGLQFDRVP